MNEHLKFGLMVLAAVWIINHVSPLKSLAYSGDPLI